jgi:hypothetical protein
MPLKHKKIYPLIEKKDSLQAHHSQKQDGYKQQRQLREEATKYDRSAQAGIVAMWHTEIAIFVLQMCRNKNLKTCLKFL